MRCVLAFVVLRFTGAFIAPAVRARSQHRLHAAAVIEPAKDVPKLIEKQRATIDALKEQAPDFSEVALLRFALAFPTQSEASKALKDTLAWRSGAGREIVDAAGAAYKEAFATGKWNNDPVREGAPHAKAINQYITEKKHICRVVKTTPSTRHLRFFTQHPHHVHGRGRSGLRHSRLSHR